MTTMGLAYWDSKNKEMDEAGKEGLVSICVLLAGTMVLDTHLPLTSVQVNFPGRFGVLLGRYR